MSGAGGGKSGPGKSKDKPKKKKTTTKTQKKDGGPKLSATEQFYGTSGKVEQPMADYYDRFTTEAVDPISMLPPDYFNRLGGYLFRRNPDEGGDNPPVDTKRPSPDIPPDDEWFPDVGSEAPGRNLPFNVGGMFAGPNSMGSETVEFDPSMLGEALMEDFGSSPTEQFGMAGRKAIVERNRAALNEEPAQQGNLTVRRKKKVVTPPVFADANYNDFNQFDPMRFAPRGGIF